MGLGGGGSVGEEEGAFGDIEGGDGSGGGGGVVRMVFWRYST